MGWRARIASLVIALAWAAAPEAMAQGVPAAPGEAPAPGGGVAPGEIEQLRRLFGAPAPAARGGWPVRQYDPAPARGEARRRELVLPMPCGGAMVFVRVEVGGAGAGLLGERRVELGGGAGDGAVGEARRTARLGGAFDSGRPGRRHYYLGKYEVTDLQYRVLRGPCPEPLEGRLPAVRVSWYEAVDFTRRYTEWLYRAARARLPTADRVPAYVRLPTEAEWEFAARGGIAVDRDAFARPLFPMPAGSIDDYAWTRESVAPTFAPRPIGTLRPNPLGLHDVLGNVAELVFDLYRLSTPDGLHGQAGAALVKGGHFRSWRDSLTVAWRREHPHFNPRTGAVNRLDTVGFRVALSAPVLTSERRLAAVERELARREALARAAGAAGVGGGEAAACRALAGEVLGALADLRSELAACLAETGKRPLPAFPDPPPGVRAAPDPLPDWETMRGLVAHLGADQAREYGVWLLEAGEPGRALVVLKQAVRKGDPWAAVAIGAMYDPRVFADPELARSRSPFSRPNPDLARCWYRLAEELGSAEARPRARGLADGAPAAETGPGGGSLCESLMRSYLGGR